jgi:hypothetical protein
MEMMLDDYATIYPSENQLRKYLSEHLDIFRLDPMISFRHLYYPFEDKEEAIIQLFRLQKGMSIDKDYAGGLLLVASEFENESQREIKKLFGNSFTLKVFELEVGNWQGPIESAYGWHLVKVSQLTEGKIPDLNEIWDEVEREWSFERKKQMKEEQYKIMREQYEVIIESM